MTVKEMVRILPLQGQCPSDESRNFHSSSAETCYDPILHGQDRWEFLQLGRGLSASRTMSARELA